MSLPLTNLPHLLFAWATPLEEFMHNASDPVTMLIISLFLVGAVLVAIRVSSPFNRQLAFVFAVVFLVTLLVGIYGRMTSEAPKNDDSTKTTRKTPRQRRAEGYTDMGKPPGKLDKLP